MVRRLGQGGMAEVFEAELEGAQGFSRRVAIKRILPHVAAAPELAARFLEEARIASNLHHAGIVAIFDFGIIDGLPFQVLELVDGLDAGELCARCGGKLPLDLALIVAADVAHALDHAHHARDADGHLLGIVHRDVKPANVLVSWSGDIKLGDFGIAFAHGRAIRTEAGIAPGTWAFMAPEQRLRGHIDQRADVFALGCTLHALLTGTSPAEAADPLSTQVAGAELPLSPEVPADLRALISRAVALAPEQRFASAAEFAQALGTALAPRLTRDPRGRLREFLAPLRAEAAPRPGLLDHLLAVELVLTSQADGLRQFEARKVTEKLAPPERIERIERIEPIEPLEPIEPIEPVAAPKSPAAPESPTERAPAPRRGPRVAALGALLTVALSAALAVAWWPRGADAPGRAPASPPADEPSPAAEPSPVVMPPAPVEPPAAEPTAPASPSSKGAPAQGAPARAPSSREPSTRNASRREPSRREPTAPEPSAKTSPPSPPAAPVLGYLKVVARDRSDRRLLNARIYIDGVLRGYAPDPIATTVGSHKVRVVLEDDLTDAGSYSIDVTDNHRDRGHPATLAVP